MKKIIYLLLLGTFAFADSQESNENKEEKTNIYFTGDSSDRDISLGVGTTYGSVSIETVYKRNKTEEKSFQNLKDLENYFKTGNIIGVNLIYKPGSKEATFDSKTIKNIEPTIIKPDIKINYNIKNDSNFKNIISKASKNIGSVIIDTEVNLDNDIEILRQKKKSLTLLKKYIASKPQVYKQVKPEHILTNINTENNVVIRFKKEN